MREIRWYRTWAGRAPAAEFIHSLSPQQQRKVTWTLERVEQDERVSPQYLKKLRGTDELWEIRVQSGNDAFRLLCFFDGARVVVVVSGFAKKSEQTPQAYIETAHLRRQDYFRRKDQA